MTNVMPHIIRILVKKIARLIVLLIGITFISFLVIHLAPGNPVDAQNQMNPRMTTQAKEKLAQLYGLDKPVLVQYANWCRRLLLFDFGNSFMDGKKVTQKIGEAIPVTLVINLLSLLIIFFAGVPLGVLGALRKDAATDKMIGVLSLFLLSVPAFWLSLVLVWVFGVCFRVFPASGIHSLFYEEMPPFLRFLDLAKHLALPVFISSLAGLAALSRYMRSSMIEVLGQNYIRTARAKGLPEREVLYRHALKNAILPVLTILGLSIPGLLGGSVVIETIFSIPGMGRLFFNSVFARDYPVIMGMLTLGAILTLLGNTLADLAYAWADPRVRDVR